MSWLRIELRSILLGMVLFCIPGAAQTVPTVSFTLDFPGSDPSHYSLSIAADGKAVYQSDGQLSSQSEKGVSDDPYQKEFSISQSTVNRVFELARRADYFQGTLDSKRKGLASTGKKTLAFHDSSKNTQAVYDYSPNSAVQALTELLEGISATLEFGHRLAYDLHYQKLALEDQLSKMEQAAKSGDLPELQAVAPILQEISGDSTVMNVSRSRAQRLLAKAAAAKP